MVMNFQTLFIHVLTPVCEEGYICQQEHDSIAVSYNIIHMKFFVTTKCSLGLSNIGNKLLIAQIVHSKSYLAHEVCMIKLPAMMFYITDQKKHGSIAVYIQVV